MNFRSGYFCSSRRILPQRTGLDFWFPRVNHQYLAIRSARALTVDILKRSQPNDAIALGVDFHKGGEIHRMISEK